MGRSGGGGGGHIGGGGHGGGMHHGSSHLGSSRGGSFGGGSFGGGSFGGGFGVNRHSAPRDYGRNRNYGGPGMPPPPPPRSYGGGYYRQPRTYYGGGGGCASGCGSFVFLVLILILLLSYSAFQSSGGGTVSDNNISEYAEMQYQTIFKGREDCMLIVIDDKDDGQIKYGTKANGIMDNYADYIWTAYDNNYNDDLGIQLKGMFEDTLKAMENDNALSTKVKSDKSFDSHCYRDDINWVDTKGNLVQGAEEFYNATGIQTYVLLVKSNTIKKATNKSSGVLKVFIIAVAIIIVVLVLFNWWKKKTAQKNKEQEDLEKILDKPLETFGNDISDLTKKYDDK